MDYFCFVCFCSIWCFWRDKHNHNYRTHTGIDYPWCFVGGCWSCIIVSHPRGLCRLWFPMELYFPEDHLTNIWRLICHLSVWFCFFLFPHSKCIFLYIFISILMFLFLPYISYFLSSVSYEFFLSLHLLYISSSFPFYDSSLDLRPFQKILWTWISVYLLFVDLKKTTQKNKNVAVLEYYVAVCITIELAQLLVCCSAALRVNLGLLILSFARFHS